MAVGTRRRRMVRWQLNVCLLGCAPPVQSRHVAAWPLGGVVPATQINAVAIRETCFENGAGQPGEYEDLIIIDVNSRSTVVLINGVDVTASLQTFNARATSAVCGGFVRRTSEFPIGHTREGFEVRRWHTSASVCT